MKYNNITINLTLKYIVFTLLVSIWLVFNHRTKLTR